MATSRDLPNPLRPYYRPPSIGIPQDTPGTTSAGTSGLGPNSGSAAAYASSAARDMFDYSDYLADSSPSSLEAVRKTLDDWLYKYFSTLLSQPFDVAKTILQVRSQGDVEKAPVTKVGRTRGADRGGYRGTMYNEDYPSDDSDQEEAAYFTSSAPAVTSYSPSRQRRRRASSREDYRSISRSPGPKPPSTAAHLLVLKKGDSILEVVSQEWTTEGAWGVWKASNATFMYGLLLQTLEQWSRGLYAGIFNVPEAIPALAADLTDAQYPWASLGVTIAAAVSAGLVLAPLDLVRTKLILTPISTPKRSLVHNSRILPSYFCPPSLAIPTILHSLVTPTVNHSTPLLLRSHLGIDPILTPTTFSIATFLTRTAELFLKLPLETVLRRAQASILKSSVYTTEIGQQLETVVEPGPYNGVFGTMWSIVYEEGGSTGQESISGTAGGKEVSKSKTSARKGQGVEGLWRGWRVGMWGIAGMWAAGAMGGSGGNPREF